MFDTDLLGEYGFENTEATIWKKDIVYDGEPCELYIDTSKSPVKFVRKNEYNEAVPLPKNRKDVNEILIERRNAVKRKKSREEAEKSVSLDEF